MLKFLCDKLQTFTVCFQNSFILYWNELCYCVCFFSLYTFYSLLKWKYLIGYVFFSLWIFQYCLSAWLLILFLMSREMFVFNFTMSILVPMFPHALRHQIREKRIYDIYNINKIFTLLVSLDFELPFFQCGSLLLSWDLKQYHASSNNFNLKNKHIFLMCFLGNGFQTAYLFYKELHLRSYRVPQNTFSSFSKQFQILIDLLYHWSI